jgi:ADP-ribosylglycohydrolase
VGDKGKAMVMASFAADSLALGVHWIYDTESIVHLFGRVESFLKPGTHSYHSTKEKGDFTHYGDQAFVLLESLTAEKGFDLSAFSARWRALFDNYDGYMDYATRATLSNYDSGGSYQDPGSPSDDLAGAARIAPLVYAYTRDIDRLVKSVKAQTRMTHDNPLTVNASEFFGRVAWQVLQGARPTEAMQKIAEERFVSSPLSGWVREGLESKTKKTVPTITRFGQSCHTEEAFPGVVHLIAKYEEDLREGLIQSVMAGGDSAARGMIVGMVLGAHLGMESLPQHWIDGLKRKDKILRLLDELTVLNH